MRREHSVVLAIEPDSARAEALRLLVRDRLGVELVMVSSPYAAIVAMNRQLPELLLFSSSLSDRNQNKVVSHYRSLADGVDPQTLIIPLFRDTAEDAKQNSRFSFKWKRSTQGASSDVFLERLASYLAPAGTKPQAVESAAEAEPAALPRPVPTPQLAEVLELSTSVEEEPTDATAFSPEIQVGLEPLDISSPATTLAEVTDAINATRAVLDATAEPTPATESSDGEELSAELVALLDELHAESEAPVVATVVEVETSISVVQEPSAFAPEVDDDPDLNVDLTALLDRPAPVAPSSVAFESTLAEPGVDPEVHAAEIALVKLEAEQRLAAELERLRVEATEQRAAELARLHEEAEALRQEAMAQAREVAAAEARDALTQELARVRAEADQTVSDALNRVRSEAEQTLSAEVLRAREEAAQERAAQLAEVQAAFERAREEAERAKQSQLQQVHAAEERADEATRLARQVEAAAAQEREAQLARLQEEAEALRLEAVAKARAEVEAQARETLAAELARTRAEAEQTLNDTLSRVRDEAEQTLSTEVVRAREQAELRRAEELERLQAAVDERVSEAARVAREAAEANAARTFADELARAREQAEHTFASELARVRHEAMAAADDERARAAAAVHATVQDAAQAQANAEALRQAAIAEARAAAEAAASRAMEREVARVRADAEARVQEEVSRLRLEAERARSERSEVEAEAEKVRETAKEVEREIARVRAASEQRLGEELARVRAEAERMREAERAAAREEAERLRDAASQDARALAEAALKAEIDKAREETEVRLAAELTHMREEADRQRATELAELRTQLDQVRDSAAKQAQQAASDAIAAERARTARPPAPPQPPPGPPPIAGPAPNRPGPSAPGSFSIPTAQATPQPKRFDAPPAPARDAEAPEPVVLPPRRSWVTPGRVAAAAAAVLIAAGTASYRWLPRSLFERTAQVAPAEAPPQPAAQPAPRATARFETTPSGATVTVDGRPRGTAPLTLGELSPGAHTVVFEANGVSITRSIRLAAGQTLSVTQDLTSGFLSVFSRVPVEIKVDGQRLGSSDEGQVLVRPGSHLVVLESTRFNFRSEFRTSVKAGEVVAHTVTLPTGSLTVRTEAGAEIWVEGERAGVAPVGALAVPIGTREVVVKNNGAEARRAVEIVVGRPLEIDLMPSGAAPSPASPPAATPAARSLEPGPSPAMLQPAAPAPTLAPGLLPGPPAGN